MATRTDGSDRVAARQGPGVAYANSPAPPAPWRRFAVRGFGAAMEDNLARMAAAVRAGLAGQERPWILDLGCADGTMTKRYVPRHAAVVGVDASPADSAGAVERGIRVLAADLNRALPFASESFDAVTANQVVEHLYDTDSLLCEAFRVLRPGGLLVLSTENLASWHNIVSLLFGWQAFSLTNVCGRSAGVGNPLANLRGRKAFQGGMQHQRIFSYRGLREVVQAHGFDRVRVMGSGYYPLSPRIAHHDPRHAALITVVGRRPG